MLILGVDPGLRCTGFGGIELSGAAVGLREAGVIRSGTGELSVRLLELAAGLREIVSSLRPDVMVVESLYSHYKHPPTAILMGHARGVLIAAAAEEKVPVIDYPATRIKKSLTGHGRASKLQMQRAILSQLRLAQMPEPADVADALAVALCHANVLLHEARLSRRQSC